MTQRSCKEGSVYRDDGGAWEAFSLWMTPPGKGNESTAFLWGVGMVGKPSVWHVRWLDS